MTQPKTIEPSDGLAGVVLLLIDVINDLEFEGGEALLQHALPMARRIAELKTRARANGVPVIYVNDNFGRWRSDFHAQVERCLKPGVRGRPIVTLLRPDDEDYFVLKPRHSAFFCTALDVLLDRLKAQTLVLTGMATDICVLFTANDAHMRGYRLIVPGDCCASESPAAHEFALQQLRRIQGAETKDSRDIAFTEISHQETPP